MSAWTLSPSPWGLALGAACLALLALAARRLCSGGLVAKEMRNTAPAHGPGVVARLGLVLQALGVALVILMALRPERLTKAPTKGHVAIVEDRTGSMATADADAEGTPRAAVAQRLTEALRARLEPSAPVQLSAVEGAGTDLYAALKAVLARRPAAVVLATDGAWNAGRDPREAAGEAAGAGVPVFTVCAGSRDSGCGLRLARMTVPPRCLPGDLVVVAARLENTLPDAWSGDVVLRQAGAVAATQEVSVPAAGHCWVALRWRPQAAGPVGLRLEVPVPSADRVPGDNACTAEVVVEEAVLRVLAVDDRPRWEFRHAVEAWRGDRSLVVQTLLLDPTRRRQEPLPPDLRSEDAAAQDSSRDRLAGFPARAALAEYDAVALGEVRPGAPSEELPASAAEDLVWAVEEAGTGLILVPGDAAGPAVWAASPLAPLVPVRPLAPGDSGLRRLRAGFQPQRTPDGQLSSILALGDSPAGDTDAWRALPPLQRYAICGQALPTSTVLATLPDDRREHAGLPLVVFRRVGRGRVLYVGSDDLWRWRQAGQGQAYGRFWRGAMRGVARRNAMADGSGWRVIVEPDPALVGEPAEIAAVPRADSAGSARQRLPCTVRSPQGTTVRLTLGADAGGGGLLTGRLVPPEAGPWEVTLAGDTAPAATLTVQPGPAESAGVPARPDVLEAVSALSGGRRFQADEVEGLAGALLEYVEAAGDPSRFRLWTHPGLVGAACLLLSAGWLLRCRREPPG